jgi:hypothetical protein
MHENDPSPAFVPRVPPPLGERTFVQYLSLSRGERVANPAKRESRVRGFFKALGASSTSLQNTIFAIIPASRTPRTAKEQSTFPSVG